MGRGGLTEQNSYGHMQVVEIRIETHVRTKTQHSDGYCFFRPVHAEPQVPRPGGVVGSSAAKPVYSTSMCRIYISTGIASTQIQTILRSVVLITGDHANSVQFHE